MAVVKFDEGQKHEMSELELHCGIIGSQVLRQDGRRDGQGAFAGGELEPTDDDEAGRTDVERVPDAEIVVGTPGAEDEPGVLERAGADEVNEGA